MWMSWNYLSWKRVHWIHPNSLFDYLVGQNFVRQNFRQTKYFGGQNFRHQAEISTLLSHFCLTFVLKHWTKFSTDKIFRRTRFSTPSRNFDNFVWFLPDFCFEILDKIFDTKLKFRQFCPTKFCPIRYLIFKIRFHT